METAALLAVVQLIDRGVAILSALQAVSKLIKEKQALGQEVTLDDLKQFQELDDNSRDALAEAIDEAEAQG